MLTTPTPEPTSESPAMILAGLATLAGVIVGRGLRATPLDAVLWTALLVLVGYAGVRLVGAAIGRSLGTRADLRLQILAVLILVAVVVPVGIAAASNGRWIEAGTSTAVAILNGVLLMRMRRQLARA